MLQTQNLKPFDFQISDSTVYVNPGTARVGNSIMSFRGSNISFKGMSNFGDQTNKYQYSALMLYSYNSYPDLTGVTSLVSDTTKALSFPQLPTDASNNYSPMHPIGLFTFFSPDGTVVNLISSSVIS